MSSFPRGVQCKAARLAAEKLLPLSPMEFSTDGPVCTEVHVDVGMILALAGHWVLQRLAVGATEDVLRAKDVRLAVSSNTTYAT